MAKSVPIGHKMCKYFIENDHIKVVEGVLETRMGKKWVIFNSNETLDEPFPGYRNVERVWVGGKILWLTERDDATAKRLFTDYYVGLIKNLQRQIDEVGDTITTIRSSKVKDCSSKWTRCFGEINQDASVLQKPEWRRQNQEHWDCSEFVNAAQYADRKVIMLKQEMFIDITDEETNHIMSLKTRGAIDAAVRAMINKYWV